MKKPLNYLEKKLKYMEKYLGKKGTPLYNARKFKWTNQILKNGWAEYETWDFGGFVSPYLIERLKMFKKLTNGIPQGKTEKEWFETLDKMIEAFELCAEEKHIACSDKKILKKIETGLKLFGEYYTSIWW